ncbi:MAG: sensor histidine kinase [Lysobacterales bacterium]
MPELNQPSIGAAVWQPLRGPIERWPQSTDFFVAALSLLLTLWFWAQQSDQGVLSIGTLTDAGTYLCAFIGNFALLWRRSHGWQVHATVMCASVLVYVGSMSGGIFALAFSLYSLGRYECRHRASVTGMALALTLVVTDLFIIEEPSIGGTVAASLVIALWYFGRRLRFRGEYLRLLEERAKHLERERSVESERAVAAERTRIAREMHDIVAHQVSLMTVQAGAARTVSITDPKAAGEAMAAVEKAGRNALTEMRHLLGILRPAEPEDALQPQPGIKDLSALVKQVNDAGLNVQLTTTGSTSGLRPRLELTVYRIVQEALTNAIKHAGNNVTVTVAVNINKDRVIVTAQDNGLGGDVNPSSGHGVAGMRERVELLNGEFYAQALSGGGFEVRALLPLNNIRP